MPNGHKVTMFLEETGLEYRIIPVNIGTGEQFAPDFLKIAPNNRMPAIVDHAPADGGEPISVFESGAILIYLGNKTGRFNGGDVREKIDYAVNRYVNETNRLYGVLDRHLKGRDFIASDYSIADMACYPWILPDYQGQNIDDFPDLKRWHAAIKARPPTIEAYAKGNAISDRNVVSEEAKKILFGQTAATR